MATFGENLRRERELRGITLFELANATKISLRHLEALEKNQFDRLPGGVFNRGFVRAVARYMKLDEHHWVGEFVRAAQLEPEILARYAPPQAAASGPRALWSYVLLLVVFGIGAYIVHAVRVRRAAEAAASVVAAPPAPSPPPSITATPPPMDRASPTQSAAPNSLASAGTGSSGPAEAPAPPEELQLQVDALEEAWVSVVADGRALYRGLMKPGETQSFRGARRLEVTTGNASAVVLTLNGETLPPLGNPGERKNIVLTAKDLKPSVP